MTDRKYFYAAEGRARTSKVTTSNGLSWSVIAPSRERLTPARFTGRAARWTSRALEFAPKVKRAVSGAADALYTRTL